MKENMRGQKTNKKIIYWSIALFLASVVLCYLFVVIHFFFIAPNNVSMKFSLWPFLSKDAMADMCQDAVVEIKFKGTESSATEDEAKIVGVNIREDGLVLVPYHVLNKNDAEIQVFNNAGKVFKAEIVFFDQDLDFALLNCKNLDNEDRTEIRMPFVSIISKDYVIEKGGQMLTISSPLKSRFSFNGEIANYVTNISILTQVESFVGADVVFENVNMMTFDQSLQVFQGGAIFDLSGKFVGFAYADVKDEKGNFAIQDVRQANLFLQRALKDDKDLEFPLADKFVGIDRSELGEHKKIADKNENGRKNFLYFHQQWHQISENMDAFFSRDVDGIYLLQDFESPDGTIKAGSVLTTIYVNGHKKEIKTKHDLLNVVYGIKRGQKIQAQYSSFEVAEPEVIEFVA